MPSINETIKAARKEPKVQGNPLTDPDGLYSGALKRLAMTDGKFVDVKGVPKSKVNRRSDD